MLKFIFSGLVFSIIALPSFAGVNGNVKLYVDEEVPGQYRYSTQFRDDMPKVFGFIENHSPFAQTVGSVVLAVESKTIQDLASDVVKELKEKNNRDVEVQIRVAFEDYNELKIYIFVAGSGSFALSGLFRNLSHPIDLQYLAMKKIEVVENQNFIEMNSSGELLNIKEGLSKVLSLVKKEALEEATRADQEATHAADQNNRDKPYLDAYRRLKENSK